MGTSEPCDQEAGGIHFTARDRWQGWCLLCLSHRQLLVLGASERPDMYTSKLAS
jgi:hypothetical protein